MVRIVDSSCSTRFLEAGMRRRWFPTATRCRSTSAGRWLAGIVSSATSKLDLERRRGPGPLVSHGHCPTALAVCQASRALMATQPDFGQTGFVIASGEISPAPTTLNLGCLSRRRTGLTLQTHELLLGASVQPKTQPI